MRVSTIRTIAALAIAFVSVPAPGQHSFAQQHSELWGRDGDAWSPTSRLPDFSYAGYRRGEQPIPNRDVDVTVKEFGAVGDGLTDDTAAFREAIRQSPGRVIGIPAGEYLITDIIEITRSGTVLQGEGPRKSVLRFTRPLNAVRPNWGHTTTGRPTSNYSWSGGFLWVKGDDASTLDCPVRAAAHRGATSLVIDGAESVRVGDAIVLSQSEIADDSLTHHLYAGDPGPIENLKHRLSTNFHARVTKVDPGSGTIHLDRPLRTDVRLHWEPVVRRSDDPLQEVGIERIGFEFPNLPYQGHFTESGFNAIAISKAEHGWVRDVRIDNADSGIFVHATNITLQGIRIDSARSPEPSRSATGHHGVTLGGQDNLLTEFDIRTRFMHDITVSRSSAGNVAMKGKGVDLCFDHHRHAPHANLFTELDLGQGSRMFQSGGGRALGRHSAAWSTFWGIESRQGQSWPEGWGPDHMNMVGFESDEPPQTDASGRWFEPISPQRLSPRNLYEAQRRRRLAEAAARES